MASLIRFKPRTQTNWIILHDSHTTPDCQTATDVPRWAGLARHQGRMMGLLDIGYNFIIERDAVVVEARSRDVIGSHTPGHNLDSIGVCLVGGREEDGGDGVDNFTRDQRLSLLRLCVELYAEFPTIKGVRGHSEVQRYRNKRLPPCPPIDMDEFRVDLDYHRQGYLVI